MRFLRVYAAEKPGLLRELCETALPLYQEAGAASQYIDLWNVVEIDHPELSGALSKWALKFLLMFNGAPAGWVLDTALETLRAWKTPKRPNGWYVWPWQHPIGGYHEVYPAGDPAFYSPLTGESEAELAYLSISPWDRPGGETEPQFRKRARLAVEEYIRQMKKWTGRPEKTEWWHFYALALWQAGHSLPSIRNWLISRGRHVGSEGDLSGISKGLDSAAAFIEIDRRPA